jgi:hypothetical protein
VVLEVKQFLWAGDIDAKNPIIEHRFGGHSEIFVIIAILKNLMGSSLLSSTMLATACPSTYRQ